MKTFGRGASITLIALVVSRAVWASPSSQATPGGDSAAADLNQPAPAPSPKAPPLRQRAADLHPLTLSELIVRTQESADIGVAKEGIRVELLEELRRLGYINPGNSGGPMLNESAEVLAVVSWKLAGLAVEGVAFGVPTSAALDGLGLAAGPESAPELLRERAKATAKRARSQPWVDNPDPAVDSKIAAAVSVGSSTPGAYWVLRGGGIGLAITGLLGVTYSALRASAEPSEVAFRNARVINGASWFAIPVGAVAFFLAPVAFPDEEPQADAKPSQPETRVSGAVGPRGIVLQVEYEHVASTACASHAHLAANGLCPLDG